MSKTGVILINIGTPESPAVSDVGRYLREFLSDPRVLTVSHWIRWFLVNIIIVPFRASKSAHAYQQIWTNRGSPLRFHSEDLATKVASILGPKYVVRVGMRYGTPSISNVVKGLIAQRVDRLLVLPMYPQYSSSATSSATQKLFQELSTYEAIPQIEVMSDFFEEEGFIESVEAVSKTKLEEFKPDFVLMSYHGLPEEHMRKIAPDHCLKHSSCCENVFAENRFCYRAQCFGTSRKIASKLGLSEKNYAVSFQSRLGRTPWIKPYTDKILKDLRSQGHKRLAVLTPSFVADCLETVEEVGIRLRDSWKELGGEDFLAVPCVNSHDQWAQSLADRLSRS